MEMFFGVLIFAIVCYLISEFPWLLIIAAVLFVCFIVLITIYAAKNPAPGSYVNFSPTTSNTHNIPNYANGKIYDKNGKGFFEGTYRSDNIIGYYEGSDEEAAAAACLLLIY